MIIFTDEKYTTLPLAKAVEEGIKKYSPKAVYLREKSLSDQEYLHLAKEIGSICKQNGVAMYICHRADIARKLGIKNLHISVKNLSKIGTKCDFDNISVSVHCPLDAKIAEEYGATSLVFGHIFETNCKKDLQPRGTKSLEEICRATSLPVVAIGGITRDNYEQVLRAGASDFAVMSSAMSLTF